MNELINSRFAVQVGNRGFAFLAIRQVGKEFWASRHLAVSFAGLRRGLRHRACLALRNEPCKEKQMIGAAAVKVRDFRKRIRSMTDEELIEYAKRAWNAAYPRNSTDRRVGEAYKFQVAECRKELKRRHPKE